MVKKNKFQRVGIRTALSAAMLLTAASASAAIINVDGDLSDLISAVNSAPYNAADAADPLGSTESTESNNGFDINHVYSYYNATVGNGTLYLGLSVFGTVGDSQIVGDPDTDEKRLAGAPLASNNRSMFDSNETYRFELYKGTSTSDPLLLSYTVKGIDTGATAGSDYVSSISNPNSLTITHVVSEGNGVEFSIAGLEPYLAPYSFTNPRNLLIFFGAGSTDPNYASSGCTTCIPVISGAEDTHLLQMQVVPVPAAAWLLGSGLLGLMGLARRQHNVPQT